MKTRLWIIIILLFVAGCASQNQWVTVEVISEPPGARIEIDGGYIGEAPCKVSVPASSYGGFVRSTTFTALPIAYGHTVQTKHFSGGYELWSLNDPVPRKIFFDMALQTSPDHIILDVE